MRNSRNPATPNQLAKIAFTEDFHNHWGSYTGTNQGVVCLYDNHQDDKRPAQIAKLEKSLHDLGVKFGVGSYPTKGEDKGYTVVHVVHANGHVEKVLEIFQSLIKNRSK